MTIKFSYLKRLHLARVRNGFTEKEACEGRIGYIKMAVGIIEGREH